MLPVDERSRLGPTPHARLDSFLIQVGAAEGITSVVPRALQLWPRICDDIEGLPG